MSKKPSRKQRIDLLLFERGLVDSRTTAQRLVMAGEVTADGTAIVKPGTKVPINAKLAIAERLPYVSRGGIKLVAALDAFGISVNGWVAADVGASTGGFTDCLLQRGAKRIYAIDVGYGQLAWSLRNEPRVIVMERTNARYLESLPESVQLVTVDVSFISLALILARVYDWLLENGLVIILIKPQFEAGKAQVGKGGVVRDPSVHHEVLHNVLTWCLQNKLSPCGLIRSPITGPAGNIEFLSLLQKSLCTPPFDIETAIQAILGD